MKKVLIAIGTVLLVLVVILAVIMIPRLKGTDKGTQSGTPEMQNSDGAFCIEIGGDATVDKADFSYVHIDYFANGEQCGFKYTCPDAGSDVISLPFPHEDFDGVIGSDAVSEFRLDIYLSYSDYQGDEAVEQAMMGNAGKDEYLDSITIQNPEAGKTYSYRIVGNQDSGYKLEPAT